MLKLSFLFMCVGVIAGCQDNPQRQKGNTEVHDAGTDGGAPPTDIVAKRKETFDCNTTEAITGMEPVPFGGSSVDQLVIREDEPCKQTILHKRTDTGVETPLFTNTFSVGEFALRGFDGSLVACTSEVRLSAPTGTSGPGTVTNHLIENVALRCRTNVTGTWSAPVTVAGPTTNEWAAWGSSLQATSYGQFQVKWVRDFTLFPFSFVDEGRPSDDGIYTTTIYTSPSGISVGTTTKVSDSVMEQDPSTMARLPDGTLVPFNKTAEYALPHGALPLPEAMQ